MAPGFLRGAAAGAAGTTRLLRAALAGAATGGRAFTAVAALTLATPPRPVSQPDRILGTGWVKGLAVLLAVQELVLDKLPQAPSRLEPLGIGARCVSAATAGVIIARRAPEAADVEPASRPAGEEAGPARPPAPSKPAPSTAGTLACVAVATAAAVGASWLGTRWRGWAADRIGRDYVAAGLEDILAVSLAALSLRA